MPIAVLILTLETNGFQILFQREKIQKIGLLHMKVCKMFPPYFKYIGLKNPKMYKKGLFGHFLGKKFIWGGKKFEAPLTRDRKKIEAPPWRGVEKNPAPPEER